MEILCHVSSRRIQCALDQAFSSYLGRGENDVCFTVGGTPEHGVCASPAALKPAKSETALVVEHAEDIADSFWSHMKGSGCIGSGSLTSVLQSEENRHRIGFERAEAMTGIAKLRTADWTNTKMTDRMKTRMLRRREMKWEESKNRVRRG